MTSPPYWGLRDYGVDGQVGLEDSPQEFVAAMVEIFREVRRVLASHGTLWLNLGDTYAANRPYQVRDSKHTDVGNTKSSRVPHGLKAKDLILMPARVALALQEDGWWLRSDIIWAKPNPMPESIRDRPTGSHEHVFLMAKKDKYYFDAFAVREPAEWARWGDQTSPKYEDRPGVKGRSIASKTLAELDLESRREAGRNVRDVWNIATRGYPGAHYAVFPEELARRCVLAGCPERVCRICGKPQERIINRVETGFDGSEYGERAVEATGGALSGGTARSTLGSAGGQMVAGQEESGWTDCGHADYRPGIVLDPFAGSGTTLYVARNHGRHSVGIELNEEYAREHILKRLAQQSLLV